MPIGIPAFSRLSPSARDSFGRDGFLVIEKVLDGGVIARLRESLPRIFRGDFDTGVFPDEWHWREGVSLPDVTRHMANAWKSDLAIAGLVLSEDIGRLAAWLTGWSSVKLGQDTIWWKPAGTKAGVFHQDTSFLGFLSPPKTITCWFALDDTRVGAGTLQYVRGSHRWPLTEIPADFLNPEDYQKPMRLAAKQAGVAEPEIVSVEVPAGSCVIHSGETWHGSEANLTDDSMRRSIGVHMISADAVFTDRHGGYIYRRYQRSGSDDLDESFFPVLYADDRARTAWLERYCETGRRQDLNLACDTEADTTSRRIVKDQPQGRALALG